MRRLLVPRQLSFCALFCLASGFATCELRDPDGAFRSPKAIASRNGSLTAVSSTRTTPPPSSARSSHVLEGIAVRTLAMVRRWGLLEKEPCDALARVQG